MDDPRVRLFDALVAFICERTGLQRGEVLMVFQADQEFWQHHRREAREVFTGWDYEDEE